MDKNLNVPKTVSRISRNNAQYIFCTNCALLRDVWGWGQNKMTFEIMPALESGAYFLIYLI